MRYTNNFQRFIKCILILGFVLGLTLLTAQTNDLRKLVTLNSIDEPLTSVLSSLAKLSGTNIVLATDQTTGSEKQEKRVTVSIKDVAVETAVSLVAKSAGLAYKIYGTNTFLVGTKQNINEESGEHSNIIYLNNLDAAKVSKALENTEGVIVPLEGQNAIMVYGNTDTFNSIKELIQKIDVEQKQIEIRVRLIEVNLTDSKKYGIDWSRLNHLTTILAEDPVNSDGAGLPYNYTDVTGYLPHGDPTDLEALPDQQYFQRINGFKDIGHFSRQLTAFDITIDWLLENNAAKLLTDTRVTALNGNQATIHIGEVVPYVVTDNEKQIQVQREQVGIMLTVTPTVNDMGQITAQIAPEVSSVIDLVGGYVPRTKVRRITSTVTVPNEHKIIVGGLLNSTITQKTNKLPLLGDLPYIGKLFQHRYEQVENTDLIMEITPRIITSSEIKIDPSVQELKELGEPNIDNRLTRHLIKFSNQEQD
jgi:type II secretory pathway component GspD/PulD (secretin)